MNDEQGWETGFARRLRAELKSVVAERGEQPVARTAADRLPAGTSWRRRIPRAALAGAALVGVTVLVVIIAAGGGDAPAAFAVEARPEGMVEVEVRSLENPEGLETALEEVGIPASVSYPGSGMVCREPRFTLAPSGGSGRGLVSGPRGLTDGSMGGDGPIIFKIDRREVGPGQTLVLTAWPQPGLLLGDAELKVAEGTVAPCEPVPAPAASGDEAR